MIATVPARDPDEVVARRALVTSPDALEIAVSLARAEIQRARTTSDPRYLGRAQATLAPWWNVTAAPPDVLLLRATILQSLHDFPAARADLDRLIAVRPDDAQAQLTRAVVATVTGDYAAARASCAAVEALSNTVIAATCMAPLDGLAGHADEAYARLAKVLAGLRGKTELRGWAETALAELAIQRGDTDAALTHLEAIVARDPGDAYGRAALADLLMATGRAAEASELLAGHEQVDSALVRRAIAEHMTHGADEAHVVQMMRDRIAAAAERGDRIHLREEARFALEVDADPAKALRTARDNWSVQKELADARLFAQTAVAARDAEAAAPVIAWAAATGVHDAQLDRWLRQLEETR
ncbi:MAG: tetratricopeptide repeat protein [Polyangiales bacterium]